MIMYVRYIYSRYQTVVHLTRFYQIDVFLSGTDLSLKIEDAQFQLQWTV